MGLEVKGLKNFEQKIKELKEKMPKATGIFLMLQAEDLKNDVKELTPVDTGTLKITWQRETTTKGKNFSQTVFNMTDYINHVEYGHRQTPGRYVPAIGKKLKANFVRGRFMLRRAVAMRKLKFYKDLNKFYERTIEKK